MRKLIASIQMTLDGFIAGPNGEMDWLTSGQDEWLEMRKDLESADTFLLGGNMYPEYSTYWRGVLHNPKSDKFERQFAELADKTPHIVFSHKLKKADWQNTRIATDPKAEVTRLKQEPGKNIIVWGGATMISELINLGLVDELRITLTPIVLGDGLSLFKDIKGRNKLKFISARPFDSGVVLLRYEMIS